MLCRSKEGPNTIELQARMTEHRFTLFQELRHVLSNYANHIRIHPVMTTSNHFPTHSINVIAINHSPKRITQLLQHSILHRPPIQARDVAVPDRVLSQQYLIPKLVARACGCADTHVRHVARQDDLLARITKTLQVTVEIGLCERGGELLRYQLQIQSVLISRKLSRRANGRAVGCICVYPCVCGGKTHMLSLLGCKLLKLLGQLGTGSEDGGAIGHLVYDMHNRAGLACGAVFFEERGDGGARGGHVDSFEVADCVSAGFWLGGEIWTRAVEMVEVGEWMCEGVLRQLTHFVRR
jgi:hypothetical protein